jgi:dinuclear metal center YbgI/SA1388 family protein
MKLKELTPHLQAIAPLELAEDWDNVGLINGDPDQSIRKVMLTIDLTQTVFTEAKSKQMDLLLTYHPPVFEPIKKVVADQGVSPLLYAAIRAKMAIYTMHTALDCVKGGVNDLLAEIVGIKESRPLQTGQFEEKKMCKIVVFLPETDVAPVSQAIFNAGAGHIGNYSRCSFRCEGTGTFKGQKGTNPTLGTPNVFEQASEFRLETIVPVENLSQVVSAMIKSHSYEEVAYDVIPLLHGQTETGLGRVGNLEKPISKKTLIEQIKKTFRQKTVGIIGPTTGKVKRAAVCAGSCGSMLKQVIRQKCDFYLTGELKHHFALELQEAGVTTVCLSHTNSERIILPQLAKQCRQRCGNIEFIVSGKDRDPFDWR